MSGIPKWIYLLMVEHRTNNSVHERDGSISDDLPRRRKGYHPSEKEKIVSPGYEEK